MKDKLAVYSYEDLKLMKNRWLQVKEAGAVWQHPGSPRAPHAVLRSGKHSDGFIDTLQFLSKFPNLREAAKIMAGALQDFLYDKGYSEPNWVFGSPMAGIPFATQVANFLEVDHIGFNEKKGDKELICRFEVKPGDTVLLVEEMTTTGGTPQRGIDAIRAKNPNVIILPVVGAYITRCGTHPSELRDARLVPAIELPAIGVVFNEWEPDACPLCAGGSRAIANCKKVWSHLLKTMQDPEHPIPEL